MTAPYLFARRGVSVPHLVAPDVPDRTVCGVELEAGKRRRPWRIVELSDGARVCSSCDRMKDASAVQGRERACRVCGCTQDRACVTELGPCFWVDATLCSGCVSREQYASLLSARALP